MCCFLVAVDNQILDLVVGIKMHDVGCYSKWAPHAKETAPQPPPIPPVGTETAVDPERLWLDGWIAALAIGPSRLMIIRRWR